MGENHTSAAAFDRLADHVAKVKSRYVEIEKLFDGFAVTPLKSTDFRKFLEDHLSEIAMRYVVMGTYEVPDSAPADAGTPSPDAGWAIAGADLSKTRKNSLDPALAASPAAAAAMAAGVNLLDDEDDDGQPNRPLKS